MTWAIYGLLLVVPVVLLLLPEPDFALVTKNTWPAAAPARRASHTRCRDRRRPSRLSRQARCEHQVGAQPPPGTASAPPGEGPACGHLAWSDAEKQPAHSGLVPGCGADLLCDRRRAGTRHLGTARPDQSTSPTTTPLKGDACRRSSLRAVSRLRRSRTRSRAGKASVRPASSPVRCCSAFAATAARVR